MKLFAILFGVCFCMLIGVNNVFANGFLTLPLEEDFAVTSCFGCYQGHNGTDYGTNRTVGHVVDSAYDGTVSKTRDDNVPTLSDPNYGNYIKIDHGTINGKKYETIYAHLLTGKFLVKEGDKVYRGQPIAQSGNSGYSFGPHLHFEVREDGVAVDPNNSKNYLWTTNPPSHGYFSPATYFDFPNHSSQGWTPGNNTSIPEQTQGDVNTLMFLAQGLNPGVQSPSFAEGIDTDQFKKLRFSARVNGSSSSSRGYVYVKDETGSWNNEAYFSSVYRDCQYHEYEVDLANLRSSLPIRQFSIEMTDSAVSSEYWIFDWIRLISSYRNWEFSDSPQGWTLNSAASENIFTASWGDKFWKIDPTGSDPQIISPYLEIDTSLYNTLEIRLSAQGAVGEDLCIFYDFGSGFAGNQAKAPIVVDGQDEYTFSLPNNGILQRLRIDPIACGDDTQDDVVFLDYVRFCNSGSGGGIVSPIHSPNLTYISITGPASVSENSGAQYSCIAHYDDGSSIDVTNSAGWGEGCGNASIDPHGYLTTYSSSSDETCEVRAAYPGKDASYNITIQKVDTDVELYEPQNLTATPLSNGDIELNWNRGENPSNVSYRIFQDADVIATTSNTHYTVTNLRESTRYCYEAAAFMGDNESSYSDEVCVTTACAQTAPYRFIRSTFCCDIQDSESLSPVGEQEVFHENDTIVLWFGLQDVAIPITPRAEFFLPDGSLYYTQNWEEMNNPDQSDWVFQYSMMTVDADGGCERLEWQGDWTVKVYINDELVDTNHFTVQYTGEVASTVYYKDYDGDGYSDGKTRLFCPDRMSVDYQLRYKLAKDLIAASGDCNDRDSNIHPNAPDVCDGKDNNCDGQIDENTPPARPKGLRIIR